VADLQLATPLEGMETASAVWSSEVTTVRGQPESSLAECWGEHLGARYY